MPPKNKSPDSKPSVPCIYCGAHISSTSSPPVQKSPKTKGHSPNHALAARIRRRKYRNENLAHGSTLNSIKRRRHLKRKQKKRVQPMKKIREAEENELSPLYKGIILGLRLSSYNRELLSDPIAQMPFDQYRELLLKTPLYLHMRSLVENLALQSEQGISAANLSQEAQHGSPAVIGSPNQTECPDETIDLTSIHTQTVSGSQLPRLGSISSRTINQIGEPAPLPSDSVPSLIPIQEDDPMLKPDEPPTQKTEVCLSESESQIRDQ